LVQKIMQTPGGAPNDPRRWIDVDGFTHIEPTAATQPSMAEASTATELWVAEIARFVEGFRHAAERDLLHASDTA
jgi:hypothetical protein